MLVSQGLVKAAEADPSKAIDVLRRLEQYISLRYAGELGLAVEYVASLGEFVPADISFPRDKYDQQVAWLQREVGPDQ